MCFFLKKTNPRGHQAITRVPLRVQGWLTESGLDICTGTLQVRLLFGDSRKHVRSSQVTLFPHTRS